MILRRIRLARLDCRTALMSQQRCRLPWNFADNTRLLRQRIDHRDNALSRDRVTPIGRNIAERYEDKAARGGTRMRQHWPAITDPAIEIDQIEIERTRRICYGTHASEHEFDFMQTMHQCFR